MHTVDVVGNRGRYFALCLGNHWSCDAQSFGQSLIGQQMNRTLEPGAALSVAAPDQRLDLAENETYAGLSPPAPFGRRVLILDVCNLLLHEPTAPLSGRMAIECDVSVDHVARVFRQRFRDELWSGSLAEDVFWSKFAEACGGRAGQRDIQLWREGVITSLRPLPTALRLPDWTRRAQVWLLTNLRHEWLDPVMERLGWLDLVDRVLISSRTGLIKPNFAAYAQLLAAAQPGDTLLYVGDKPAHVSACTQLGIDALRATARSRWTATVDRWLGGA